MESGKIVTWEAQKNEKLKANRNISFEQIRAELEAGRFKIEGNASRNHPGQSIYLVALHGYVYVVPFRKIENTIFLITAFPSRVWQEKVGGDLL